MGLMTRIVAGGVLGGAQKYNQIRDEERAEARDTRKDEREQRMWEMRQDVLQDFQTDMKMLDFGHRSAVEAQSHQNSLMRQEQQQTFDAGENQKDREADARKPLVTSAGQDVIDPTKTAGDKGQVIYRNDDKSASGSGGKDAMTKIDERFFSDAKALYQVDDLSSMDEATRNSVTRLASVASQLQRRHPDLDRNTILLKSYEHIRNTDPSAEIMDIVSEMESYDDEWWLTDSQERELQDLNARLDEAAKKQYSNDLPDLGGGGPSLMARPKPASTSEGGEQPVQIRNADEWGRLRPGQQYIDPNGVLRVKQ